MMQTAFVVSSPIPVAKTAITQAWLDALRPLLKALNWKGGERSLREALPDHDHNEALTLKDICAIMAHLGFASRVWRGHPRQLDDRLLPALWVGADHKPQLVATPEDLSSLHNTRATFLLFAPGSAQAQTGMLSARRFYPLFKQIFAMSLFIGVLALAPTVYNMAIYDQVIASGSSRELLMLLTGALLALGAEIWFRHVRAKGLAYLGARIDHFVSCSVFEQLLFLPPVHTERASVSAQIARLRDFESVREFFTGPLAPLLFETPLIGLYLVAMAVLSGSLVWVPVALLIAYGLLLWGMHARLRNTSRQAAATASLKQEFLLETITKLRAIRLAGLEAVWRQRFRDVSARASKASFDAGLNAQAVETASYVLMTLGAVMTLGFGVQAVIEQHLSIGALIAAMMLIWRIVSPLQMVCASMTRLQQLGATTRQVKNLLVMPVEHDPVTTPAPLPAIKGHLSFHRVVLRYTAESEPALLGVSFIVQPGKIIAIRGGNGSGKSSLLKLALGLYAPQGGSVRLDGVDIRQFDPVALRQNIAYVPQYTDIFPGTIRDNLLFADPVSSEEACIRALHQACALDEIINLSNGLDTVIAGEGAEPISLLLKSRLSLARAYLAPKPVMLFDEVSHALGHENDQAFARLIGALRGRSTVLMVTHREDHMRLADALVVLNKGELTHAGPPQQVLNVLREKRA